MAKDLELSGQFTCFSARSEILFLILQLPSPPPSAPLRLPVSNTLWRAALFAITSRRRPFASFPALHESKLMLFQSRYALPIPMKTKYLRGNGRQTKGPSSKKTIRVEPKADNHFTRMLECSHVQHGETRLALDF